MPMLHSSISQGAATRQRHAGFGSVFARTSLANVNCQCVDPSFIRPCRGQRCCDRHRVHRGSISANALGLTCVTCFDSRSAMVGLLPSACQHDALRSVSDLRVQRPFSTARSSKRRVQRHGMRCTMPRKSSCRRDAHASVNHDERCSLILAIHCVCTVATTVQSQHHIPHGSGEAQPG